MTYQYKNPLRALIIDDDNEFTFLATKMLKSLNVNLIILEKAEELFQQIKTFRPQLIMIDGSINKSHNGLSLSEVIRKNLNQQAVIFIVSAENSLEATTQAIELGATDYITKPLNKEILKHKLLFYFRNNVSFTIDQSYRSPSLHQQTIQIEFESQIESIDEFGIQFRSHHLIANGSLIKFTGEIIKSLTEEKSIVASVIRNSRDPHSQFYVHYAEYEDISQECVNNIRKWLSSKITKDDKYV